MNWLRENWIWVGAVILFLWLHAKMHGGHGMHGGDGASNSRLGHGMHGGHGGGCCGGHSMGSVDEPEKTAGVSEHEHEHAGY